jgi:hypothetical protein
MNQSQPSVNIRVPDEVLKGVYSNMMQVSHTKEEFIFDFLNVFGPQGSQVAKIITSPEHFKRIVGALNDNLKRYEDQFGKIEEKEVGGNRPTQSESSNFGF